jgi:hypothetical protein
MRKSGVPGGPSLTRISIFAQQKRRWNLASPWDPTHLIPGGLRGIGSFGQSDFRFSPDRMERDSRRAAPPTSSQGVSGASGPSDSRISVFRQTEWSGILDVPHRRLFDPPPRAGPYCAVYEEWPVGRDTVSLRWFVPIRFAVGLVAAWLKRSRGTNIWQHSEDSPRRPDPPSSFLQCPLQAVTMIDVVALPTLHAGQHSDGSLQCL